MLEDMLSRSAIIFERLTAAYTSKGSAGTKTRWIEASKEKREDFGHSVRLKIQQRRSHEEFLTVSASDDLP